MTGKDLNALGSYGLQNALIQVSQRYKQERLVEAITSIHASLTERCRLGQRYEDCMEEKESMHEIKYSDYIS